jgi:hypothetical protein
VLRWWAARPEQRCNNAGAAGRRLRGLATAQWRAAGGRWSSMHVERCRVPVYGDSRWCDAETVRESIRDGRLASGGGSEPQQ